MKYTFDYIKDNNLLLYEYMRGSHCYGLATETSDEDYGGIFMCDIKDICNTGIEYVTQVNNNTNDIVWYEIKKYMNLLLSSNPTVLESLFVSDRNVIYENDLFHEIKLQRDKFITKECFKSFGGYAVSQITKARGLNKKIVNPITKRLELLDFVFTFYKQGSTNIKNWLEYRGLEQRYCGIVNIPNMHDTYGCYYDWGNFFLNENISFDDLKILIENNDTTALSTVEKRIKECTDTVELDKLTKQYHDIQLTNMLRFICEKYNIEFNTDSLKLWYNKQTPIGYKGIVNENHDSNELRLSSVSKNETPICWISCNITGYTKHCIDYKNYKNWEKNRNEIRYKSNLDKNYDSKNMMHSFRLINMCIEIANGKGFNVDRTDIDREFLLDVKNHKYEYDVLMEMLIEKKNEMDNAILNSEIPDKIDYHIIDDLLLNIRQSQIYK